MASSAFEEYYSFGEVKSITGFSKKFEGIVKKDRQANGNLIKAGTRVDIQQIEQKTVTDKQANALHSAFKTLLKLQDHVNVKQLIEVFEDEKVIIIVKEYVEGLTLAQVIAQQGPFSEKEAGSITNNNTIESALIYVGIILQIMSVIDSMNKMGLSHRGLTMDTITYTDTKTGTVPTIKVSEFQYAGAVEDSIDVGCFLLTANAAPHCVSPEVLIAEVPFDIKVDWWSIGVITYALLYGEYPFYDPNDAVVIQNILEAKYSFPEDVKISEEAKDFIKSLLQVHVPSRAGGDECWEHPWLNKLFPE